MDNQLTPLRRRAHSPVPLGVRPFIHGIVIHFHARSGELTRVLAVFGALRRDVRRGLGTFGSLAANNLFLFIALMAHGALNSGLEPRSAEPLLFLLTLLLLFPLSSDPLDRIPRSRFALWPLSAADRALLRVAALTLSPVLWIASIALLVKTTRPALGLLFLLTAAVVTAIASLVRRFGSPSGGSPLRWVPRFPGRLGGLVRNNIRQMLSTLDIHAALLLSVMGVAYRFLYPRPDPAAAPILTLLIGLALNTYTQCLFGLDWAGSAMTRYRLLPLRTREIVFAKDAAFLSILLVLVLPLSPLVGLTFGITSLALGHYSSLAHRLPQRRWRFTGGRVLLGVVEGIGALVMGCFARDNGVAALALSAVLYLASLAACERLGRLA